MLSEFSNEPLTDFSIAANNQAMHTALRQIESELGREYPLVISGEKINTGVKFESINPARNGQVVGRFQKADRPLAGRAVTAACEKFQEWKRVPAPERADLLFRVASLL